MDKLLTISVAAYNVEKTLERAVNSVVKAKNKDCIELIIINDGSTDGTLKVANYFQKAFSDVVRVIDKVNGGYGSTVNEAIKAANGKYFRLLDGDDFYDTNELDIYLNELKTADEDMVISDYKVVSLNDRKTVSFELSTMKSLGVNDVDMNIDMHAITYKIELLKKSNLSLPEHCLYTDALFCLIPMFYVSSVKYIANSVYQYCIGDVGQSVSKVSRVKHISDVFRIVDVAFSFSNEHKNEVLENKMLINKLASIHRFCIDSLLLMPLSLSNKRKIIKYENDLRVDYCKAFYSVKTKKIIVLRKTNYYLYPICSLYMKYFETN